MLNHKLNILVVDDDIRILKLLQQFLQNNDFSVSVAINVTEAKQLLNSFTYDLIILDVMLPNITGLEFASIIRSTGNNIPIVMLTALSEASDRVKGLESGASDYMTKPFEPKELLLRINNLVRKNNTYLQNNPNNITVKYFGNNYYNFSSKEFKKNNQPVQLSSTEQKLLELLLENSGQIFSREDLSKLMGGISPRSIDVKITRIRSKIEDNPKEPKYLRTIRNGGYAIYT
ncbi:MAG: response regulator transcription factor [Rickettsia endosymbiont of Bryobia graminum]|nr:response regulator transcription factor [Rickettsia endosymbiont of Bryobia graminum]